MEKINKYDSWIDMIKKYDIDGYSEKGFNKIGMHRNGDYYDDEGYDVEGYSERGFDRKDMLRNGTKYDDEGYDIDGYNEAGYDKDGYCKYCYNNPCDCCID